MEPLEGRCCLSAVAGLDRAIIAFPGGDRGDVTGVGLGNLAFFAGFSNNALSFGNSHDVAVLNVATRRWYHSTLSRPRANMAATALPGIALFAGGLSDNLDDNGALADVDIYSAVRNRWTTARLSAPRWGPSATSVDGLALIAGGYGLGNAPSGVVDIYYARRGRWSAQSLSAPRASIGATSVGNQAFFADGFDTLHRYSDVVDVFDAPTNHWSVAHLSQARAGVAAVSVNGLAIFAGGKTEAGPPSHVVDIYDPATDAWSVTHLPAVDGIMAVGTLGDNAIFYEGYDLDVYNTRTGTWTSNQITRDLHGGVAGVTADGHALFAGGFAANGRPSALIEDFTLPATSNMVAANALPSLAAAAEQTARPAMSPFATGDKPRRSWLAADDSLQ